MTPLETRLTHALAADVARFDSLGAEGEALRLDSSGSQSDLLPLRPTGPSPRRRRGSVVAVVAAAALICLAIVAIATRRNDDTPGSNPDSVPSSSTSSTTAPTSSSTTPIVASAPVEQPLVETEISGASQVAKPGSAHAFKVTGHPNVEMWTTLSPNVMTGEVEEWQCVSEAGGSGCGPTSMPAQFGQTSSIDNRVATDDLFTWSNLPPDVDTVRYDDGVAQLWQHPVAGLAIFRVDPNHPHPTITAYDATGAALPYLFWGQNAPLTPPTETTVGIVSVQPATPSADGELWGELETLTQTSLQDCLSTNGASWPMTDIPTFSAGVDPTPIWNACAIEVNSIVAARLAELNKGN